MSQATRPPVTTPFWIGDTVYRKHGTKNAGIVLGVSFDGDPAYPSVTYRVNFPKDCYSEDFYALELTREKPPKSYGQ